LTPRSRLAPALAAGLLLLGPALSARAQAPAGTEAAKEGYVSLDFDNAELSDVIDLIAKLTNKNFIYDDRVRGRVTIVSPTQVTIEQAYAVFESVLQVKGFTTVESPGGAVKVIPLREAKETNVETVYGGRPLNRDRFITRLIPLQYIEADPIVNTLKPLVSKDAAIAAYAPTNTVILTESASNIRRIIGILQSIDVENYRPALAVIKIEHADASTLAEQIAEIYGAETATTGGGATGLRARRQQVPRAPGVQPDAATGLGGIEGSRVKIITDERTNSLIVLSPRTQLEDVRGLVRKLDVPVEGGGSIHVYYLKNADAEELAATLNSLISGQPRASKTGAGGAGGAVAGGGAGQVQSLRASVTELAEGISVTADPATNSLVIQASKEGYSALKDVIALLDIERPQVLVEALIMEVDVSDNQTLGFNGVLRFVGGSGNDDPKAAGALGVVTDSGSTPTTPNSSGQILPVLAAAGGGAVGGPLLSRFAYDFTNSDGKGFQLETILRAAASDSGTNILSAPHILTSDNEEAEIRVGDNIPIISQRLNNAVGNNNNLAQSVSVERQDVGVTLRVTPQITEGDSLRLEISQEITAVNTGLQTAVGNVEDVGPALSNRKVENVVVVKDGETVVIGGLLSNSDQDSVSKVPFLGDIPVLGWLFKTKTDTVTKTNLLVFLTPHIIRKPADLERNTIDKREQFLDHSHEAQNLTDAAIEDEREKRIDARVRGERYRERSHNNPVRMALLDHEVRYPLERMHEIEQEARESRSRAAAEAEAAEHERYLLQAALFGDEQAAADALTNLIDAGFDGTLVTTVVNNTTLYEVRVGPFDDRAAAERAAETLRSAHNLSPRLVIEDAKSGDAPESRN
jgi:general secretion pathway protein D